MLAVSKVFPVIFRQTHRLSGFCSDYPEKSLDLHHLNPMVSSLFSNLSLRARDTLMSLLSLETHFSFWLQVTTFCLLPSWSFSDFAFSPWFLILKLMGILTISCSRLQSRSGSGNPILPAPTGQNRCWHLWLLTLRHIPHLILQEILVSTTFKIWPVPTTSHRRHCYPRAKPPASPLYHGQSLLTGLPLPLVTSCDLISVRQLEESFCKQPNHVTPLL